MIKNLVIALLLMSTYMQAKDMEKVSLQLSWLDRFQFAGYYMAKEKGFYNDIGLDVEIRKFSVDTVPVEEVKAKRATYGVGGSSLIIDRSEGKKVVLLSAILQSSPSILLALRDSNITKIEDFVGKRVMITKEMSTTAPIHSMVAKYHISREDVTILKHSFDLNDLINKKTDLMLSYITSEPFLLKQKGVAYKIFNPRDYGFDFYSDILFTCESETKNHKQRAVNFTNASLAGWEYAFNHIEESVDVILKKYNSQNLSREALIYEAHELKKLAYMNNYELGHIEERKIEKIYDVYNLLGLVEHKIDFDQLIYHNDKHRNAFLTDEEIDYLTEKKELSVCVKSGWLPYESIEDGVFVGIGADYLNLIAKELELSLKIVHAEDKYESIKFLKEMKCDIKPTMSVEGEKKLPYKLTEPILEDYFTLTTRIEQPFIANFDNYIDEKYVVVKGHYALLKVLRTKYPNIELIEVENIKTALEMVADEYAFGYFGQSLSSIYYIQKYFSAKLKVVNDFKNFTLGIGVRNDEIMLTEIINKTINSIPESKKREILNSWVSTTVAHEHDYTLVWQLLSVFVVVLSIVLFFLIRQNRLKYLIEKQLDELEEFNNLLEEKVEQRTAEQNVLLSLFDLGTSVLFKWNNDEQWSVSHVSKSVTSLLEYDRDELMSGKASYIECIHKDDLEKVKQEVRDAIEFNREYFEHEPYRLYTKSGKIKWVHDSTIIVRDNDGKIINFVGYTTDITMIKDRDQKLLQQSKLAQMGEMISMIAHQWRQPLGAIAATSINLKTKIILQTYDLSKEEDVSKCNSYFNDKLSDIESYVQLLTKTIDDFRDFYKPNKQSVETIINAPLQKALQIIQSSIKSKNIEISKRFESTSKVLLFESEIMQVILNILQNAQDNFQEKKIQNPIILLNTYDSENKVIVEICDNGGGVPDELITKIFDPYFSTKHERNGTGLGLYMSKTIIDEHHSGKLQVSNIAGGACFKIELPLSSENLNKPKEK